MRVKSLGTVQRYTEEAEPRFLTTNSVSVEAPAKRIHNVRSILLDSIDSKSSMTRQLPTNETNPSLSRKPFATASRIFSATIQTLDSISSATASVNRIIECTYDHDSETGERLYEPGEHSAADIMAMICNVETEVRDASRFAVGFFGDEQADQSANA